MSTTEITGTLELRDPDGLARRLVALVRGATFDDSMLGLMTYLRDHYQALPAHEIPSMVTVVGAAFMLLGEEEQQRQATHG